MPSAFANSRRYAALFGLLLSSLLAACGFHSDVAGLTRLRAQIHEQIGTDASVNVHTAYGATTVTIRLDPAPKGDSKWVQQRVEALTKTEFPNTDYVVVLARP